MDNADITIQPSFSVYQLVGQIKSQTLLQHRRTMSLVSYQIENATIKHGARSRIFAGFQRMSKFIRQIARYNQLALNAEFIYVFGIPDISLPAIPNVTYVPLKPTDQLAREWFLVSYAPDYFSALATEEITHIDDPDERRIFRGVWTYELPMVSILHDWLSNTVGAPPAKFTSDQQDFVRQVQLMSDTISRLSKQIGKLEDQVDQVLAGEVKTVLKENVAPALEDMNGSQSAPASQEKHAVILFCDIRNYTALAEQLSPLDLVNAVLMPYLNIVTELIDQFGGKVDKFIGDGVLAVFDSPEDQDEGTDHVISAARAIIERVTTMQHRISGAIPIDVGIGLSAGKVIESAVGPEVHTETTVIGDPVNIAQRLSDKGHNTIWLDEYVYEGLSNTEGMQSSEPLELKGKSKRVNAYYLRVTPSSTA